MKKKQDEAERGMIYPKMHEQNTQTECNKIESRWQRRRLDNLWPNEREREREKRLKIVFLHDLM